MAVTPPTTEYVSTDCGTHFRSDARDSAASDPHNSKPASPSSFFDGEDNHFAEYPFTQIVQDYIFGLDANQACVARLQSAGYNQCETSHMERPSNLWYDSCIKLTGSTGKRQDSRDLKEKERLRTFCNEYLDILRAARIESVDVDGAALEVRTLFAYDLSLDEMEKQVAAVKEKLQELQSDHLQASYQRLMQREAEFRRSFEILRDHFPQVNKGFQKPTVILSHATSSRHAYDTKKVVDFKTFKTLEQSWPKKCRKRDVRSRMRQHRTV